MLNHTAVGWPRLEATVLVDAEQVLYVAEVCLAAGLVAEAHVAVARKMRQTLSAHKNYTILCRDTEYTSLIWNPNYLDILV